MKKLLLLLLLTAYCQLDTQAQAKFELEPGQNMLMTGKGQGQDGAINPYFGQKSIAIVRNLGPSGLYVRIQKEGELIENVAVDPRKTRKFVLEEGYELYLDSEGVGRARLDFKKY